jgi:hypothetical protein
MVMSNQSEWFVTLLGAERAAVPVTDRLFGSAARGFHMFRAIATLLPALLLGACATESGGWTLQASATAGAAMVYRDVDLELRIACRRDPADLFVSLNPPGIWPFKVTSRTGDFEIVSYARGGATAEVTPEAVEAMASGVHVTAGERTFETPTPPEEVADAFRGACGAR